MVERKFPSDWWRSRIEVRPPARKWRVVRTDCMPGGWFVLSRFQGVSRGPLFIAVHIETCELSRQPLFTCLVSLVVGCLGVVGVGWVLAR